MEKLNQDECQLLRRVIKARAPAMLSLVDTLGRRHLSVDEREALRGALADELTAAGLNAADEPTEYGQALDDLIGRLMDL
jgi:hypothetical protein